MEAEIINTIFGVGKYTLLSAIKKSATKGLKIKKTKRVKKRRK